MFRTYDLIAVFNWADEAAKGRRRPGPQRRMRAGIDTMGVDFASYLSGVNDNIHKSWLTLVPDVVRPPTTKKGKVVIEWSITRDGSPADLRLVSSSNDTALDRAANLASTP